MFVEFLEGLKDDLTQVYSRGFLDLILQKEIKKALRYGTTFSILYIDLDDFNLINNLYSHSEGDRVLYEFAKFLKNSLRETDYIVRYGGDEFIVLLTHTNLEGAKLTSNRILESLKNFDFGGVKLSCSIGIVEVPTHGSDWQTIFSKLEIALFRAKKQGKRGFYFIQNHDLVHPVMPSPTFIGRRSEIASLIDEIEKGTHPIIAVTGETGIGKTRFVEEVLKHLDAFQILASRASAVGLSSPYYPFLTILKKAKENDYLEFSKAYNQLEEIEKVALGMLTPELGYLPENVDRYKLYDAFSKMFSLISKKVRTLIFIDDLHLSSPQTLELIYYLSHSEIKNLKIIVTFIRENIQNTNLEKFLTHLARERFLTEIKLSQLTRGESYELIEALLQGKCSEKLKVMVYEKSGGNPYFIEEILKELYKRETIVFSDNEWQITQPDLNFVPETINGILLEKTKKFEGEKFLEYAACLGNEIEIRIMELLLGTNKGEIYDIVDKLLKERILFEKSPDIFAFKEGLIREVIISKLSSARKRFLHKHILSTLESYGSSIPFKEKRLAYHAIELKEKEKIKAYALKAARNLRDQFSYEEALRYFEAYLENEEDKTKVKEALIEYVDLLILSGLTQKAEQAIANYLNKNKDDADLLNKLSEVYSNSGKFGKALETIEKAIKVQQKPEFFLRKAWLLLQSGKIDESQKTLEKINISDQNLSDYARSFYLNSYGLLLMDLERYREAEEKLLNALEIREKIGNLKGVANVHLNLGTLYSYAGEYKKSIEEYEKAKEIYEKIGDKIGVLRAIHNYSETLINFEYYEEAQKGLEESVILARKIGDFNSLFLGLCNLAKLYIDLGYSEKVEDLLNEANSLIEEVMALPNEIYLRQIELDFYSRAKKDKNKSLHIYNILKEKIPLISSKSSQIDTIVSILNNLIFLGEIEEAKELITHYSQLLEEEENHRIKLQYYCIKAVISKYTNNQNTFKETLKNIVKIKNILNPKNSGFYNEKVAMLLHYLGKKKGARKILSALYEKAQKENKLGYAKKINNLILLLITQGED